MARNISGVTKIRRKVLTEVASLMFKGRLVEEIDKIPQKLIDEGLTSYRCCQYKEKAIFRQRIKLALGLDPKNYDEDIRLSELAQEVLADNPDYQPKYPYISIIEEACDHCSIDKIVVTNACRNCVAHHCVNTCPRGAISIVNNRAFVDRNKCVECGLCIKACPYGAIIEVDRPCSRACAVDAIVPGEKATSQIDRDKCVECGSCITACPFGAVSFKSEMASVIKMLLRKEKVFALVAPSYIGQFGKTVSWDILVAGLKGLGFYDVFPAAVGADVVIEKEGKELVDKMNAGEGIMFNSCCPSFKNLIEKYFPEIADKISDVDSPMLEAAKIVKTTEDIKCVFIGPCVGKKGEAFKNGRDLLEAVLTFEELVAMLVAANINLAEIKDVEKDDKKYVPSVEAVNFCQAEGVGKAIQKGVKEKNVKVEATSGITNCKNMLLKVKARKVEADFIEGMGCEGGCIGGHDTLINAKMAKALLLKLSKEKEGIKK